MRKVLLLGGLVLLLSGCTSGEEVTCQNNGLEEVYTLKDGIEQMIMNEVPEVKEVRNVN